MENVKLRAIASRLLPLADLARQARIRLGFEPADSALELDRARLAAFFRRVPDFGGLSDAAYDLLSAHAKQRTAAAGELIHEYTREGGAPPAPLMVVLVGHVEVIVREGLEIQRWVAGLTDLLGEESVVAWADAKGDQRAEERGLPPRRLVHVFALDTCIVLEIEPDDFPKVFGVPGGRATDVQRELLERVRMACTIGEQALALVATLAQQPELTNASPSTLRRLLEGATIVEGPKLFERGDKPSGFFVLTGAQGTFVSSDRQGNVLATRAGPGVTGLTELLSRERVPFDVALRDAPSAVRVQRSTFEALVRYDDDFRRTVLLTVPPAARAHWTREASGPRCFAVCADPELAERRGSPRWIAALTNLLADATARHTYDNVLVVHALPARSAPRTATRKLTPERIPGARYAPPAGCVTLMEIWAPIARDGLSAFLREAITRHPDLDVVLVESTACKPEEDPVLNAKGGGSPTLRIIYLIDRPDFAYRPPLVLEGFEMVFAALLPKAGAPVGIGLAGFRAWDAMWRSPTAFAKGLARLGRVTAANLAAAGGDVVGTVTDPESWLPQGGTPPSWPVGAVRLTLAAALEQLEAAGCGEGPRAVEDLGLAARDALAVRESLRRWARQITHRRVGIALGGGGGYGLVHLPLLTRLAGRTGAGAAPDEPPLPIDFVSGSSVGSTVGTYFCAVPHGRLVETEVTSNGATEVVGTPEGIALFQAHGPLVLGVGALGVLNSAFLQLAVWLDIGGVSLDSTPIPFFPVVTDANMGVEWDLRAGSYARGMRASGSLPPLVGPTVIGTRRYLDGGLSANVPVTVLQNEGARLVLSSNPIPTVKPLPRYQAGLQIPYVTPFLRECEIVPRVRDTVRAVPMITRSIGETQTYLADVRYSAPYDDTELFPKIRVLRTDSPPFFSLRLADDKALTSPELNQAVMQFHNAWRRLLHRAPARVWLDKVDGRTVIRLDGALLFEEDGAGLSPACAPLLHELAEFLVAKPELGAVIVRVGGDRADARQASLIAALVREGVPPYALESFDSREGLEVPLPPEAAGAHQVGLVLRDALVEATLDDERRLRRDAEARALSASLLAAAESPSAAAEPDLARLLAIEAGVRSASVDADRVLRTVLAQQGKQVARFQPPVDHPDAGPRAGVDGGEERCRREPPKIEAMAWSPTGDRLAVGARDGKARVLDGDARAAVLVVDHTGGDPAVTSVAFSPDGALLASTGLDERLQLHRRRDDGSYEPWQTGGPTWLGHWNHLPLAFSRDGKRLLGGAKQRPLVWSIDLDADTLDTVDLDLPTQAQASALRPDGAVAAIADIEGTLTLWDAATGQTIGAPLLPRGGPPVRALAYSPDGERLAAAVGAEVHVFGAAGAAPVVLRGHTGRVESVSWDASGRLLTASRDGTARVWDADGSLRAILLDPQRRPTVGAAFHPGRSALLATWNDAGVAFAWDVGRPRPIAVFTGHAGTITAGAWAPSGDRLATTSIDGTLRLWDPELSARVALRAPTGHVPSMAAWHPGQGPWIACAGSDGAVTVWDPTGALPPVNVLGDLEARPRSWAAWSADGKWLAATRVGDRRVRVIAVPPAGSAWPAPLLDRAGVPDGEPFMGDRHHDHCAFSADGRYLAVQHLKRLSVWDLAASPPAVVAEVGPTEHDLSAIAWHPTRARIAVARWTADDAAVRVFDVPAAPVAEWEPVLSLRHDEGVYAVSWSRDGARLCTGANDRLARVFDCGDAGEAVREAEIVVEMNDQVRVVAWSPADDLFAAGDSQGTVAVFDPRRRPTQVGDSLIGDAERGRAPILDLRWSADGGALVAASEVALVFQRTSWTARRGQFVLAARVSGHEDRVLSVAIRPDGEQIVTVAEDGLARLQPLTRAALLEAVGKRLGRAQMSDDEWRRYMGPLPALPTWPRSGR